MKKMLTLIICGLLIIAFSANAAWAKGGGGNQGGNGQSGKSNASTQTQKVGKSTKPNQNVVSGQKKQVTAPKRTPEQSQTLKQYKEKLGKLSPGGNAANKFGDTEKHWARNAIQNMAAIGLINGYGDGTFKPDQPVSNVEVIALMMRLTAGDESSGVVQDQEQDSDIDSEIDEDQDRDVEDSEVDEDETEDAEDIDETETEVENEGELANVPAWSQKEVKKALKLGVIGDINRFHSEVQATRAQAAVYIAKALGLDPIDPSQTPFEDCTLISAEDLGYITALCEQNLITGMPDGNFNPNSSITRAQIAAIMERILDQEETTDDSTTEGQNDVTTDNATEAADENTAQTSGNDTTVETESAQSIDETNAAN